MKFSNDLINILEKSAPSIAGLIGGPFASTAVSLLENAFGVKVDNLESTITNDPDATIKLKQLELEHQAAIMKLQVDDSINARDRQIKITELTGKKDYTPDALAFVFVVIYAVIQFMAIYNPSNQDDVISARLQDIILIIAGFYYGNINKKDKI